MKKIEATEKVVTYECEFCKKDFLRESTILKHTCEVKRRWLNKDDKKNRLGFQAWLQFYTKNSLSKKNKTYEEFIRSPYYLAFVKFGTYCIDCNVLNVSRFIDWLLKNQIKIDVWNKDTTYTKFLIEYLREEDPLDALVRSVETTMILAEAERMLSKDCFRYCNKHKICYAVTTGKISPWMLYQSESGKKFLGELDDTQVRLIIDYINPELWAIKFIRDSEAVPQVKELLVAGGY